MNLKNKTDKELSNMLDSNYEEQKNLSEEYDNKIGKLEEDRDNIHKEIIRRERSIK